MLLGCLVFLYVGNIFSGFSLFWVFLGIAINRLTKPVLYSQPVAYPDASSMPWEHPQSALG